MILSLLFYSLFLLLPVQFVKAGLITPKSLLIIFLILLAISAFIYTHRFPFFGKRFLNAIIKSPYSANDLKAALELESGRSYPGRKRTYAIKKSAAAFLSDRYIKKILKHIKLREKIIREILPDFKRAAVCVMIIIISVILSYVKSELVADVYAALKSGLPAELIAIDTPIKFEKLEAIIIPPAYFESGQASSVDLNLKNKIKVIQGSSVLIKGAVVSEIEPIEPKFDGLKSGRLILSAASGVEYFPVAVNDKRKFEASFLAPMKGAFALEINYLKIDGRLASGKSKIFTIEAMPDQPPAIRIFFPPENHNLVFGNPVEISFSASDDFGILEISLFHRNPEQGKDYYKELIARFPKEPKTSYSSTYAWNPVIREGDKLYELAYAPSTKTVEYFLEVRDINSFSSGGIARSSMRQIHFTDIYSDLKTAIDIIQELINDGKKLLSSSDRNDMNSYKKKLSHAVEIFTKELRETLPRSSLIQRTGEMLGVLATDNFPEIRRSLRSYIEYLERFFVFMNLILESESGESIDKELSGIDEMSGNMNSTLKRVGSLADMLEKEFRRDIEEIKNLMGRGEHAKAQAKLSELIKKIRKKISDDHAKSMAMSQKIADEVKEMLNKMTKQAQGLLKDQELNKSMTDKGKIKAASLKQENINKGLSDLNMKTERLSSEYPFIMFSLNSYAEAARLNGDRALQNLQKSEPVKASNYQSQVIRFLKGFLDSSSQQTQLMEELAKGNFERLLSRGYSNRFVLIPKEAVYTIPIDYKNKVIEMSKDRSKITKEKENFWRDILE